MPDLPLRCSCGSVTGTVTDTSYKTVNRVVCYCDDCQTAAGILGLEGICNEQGGTDIVQVAPGRLKILSGHEHIACLRLSPKGLMRWHTSCCSTPIGNTMADTRWWCFVGVPSSFVADEDFETLTGPVRAGIQGKFARDPATVDAHPSVPLSMGLRTMAWMAGNKLGGLASPCPYFDERGAPVAEPRMVSREQREEHRPVRS